MASEALPVPAGRQCPSPVLRSPGKQRSIEPREPTMHKELRQGNCQQIAITGAADREGM